MSHSVHDKRSLLMHRLIARRVKREPALRAGAMENIRHWMMNPGASESSREAMLEWIPLLEGPLERLVAAMTSSMENSQRLRQSSPFAGETFIRQTERLRVLKKHRS